MTNPTHCPSCGIAYTEHMGLIGTCRELQEAREAVEIVSRTSNEYMVQNAILREALEEVIEIGSNHDAFRFVKVAREALQRAGGGGR